MEIKEPTYKEVCEVMKADLQCARCGSKVADSKGNPVCDCRGGTMINRWKNCFEEARRMIINRNTPRHIEKGTNESANAIDELLDYLEN